MVWCGLRKGRCTISALDIPSLSFLRAIIPETEYILVVSNASSKFSGGNIDGSRLAIILLPAPGGPTISILCPPAAATSIARRTFSCPRTSEKSKSELNACAANSASVSTSVASNA